LQKAEMTYPRTLIGTTNQALDPQVAPHGGQVNASMWAAWVLQCEERVYRSQETVIPRDDRF